MSSERLDTRTQRERESTPNEAVLRTAVAEAAYYRAQERGFEPGHELDDWLAAEHDVLERQGAGVIG